jgi:farnesyl diphosphate synthase
MDEARFAERLARRGRQVEALLDGLLSPLVLDGEVARPSRLLSAMRHGVLNGGKRLRPFLLMETAAMLAGNEATALRAAAAIECIHCYSLIHDDLPAMDDDDLRRGQPTVHVAYDEATAILAGDALLTLAFDILASEETHADPAVRSELVLALSRASGLGGMAGGQMLDLSAEHKNWDAAQIRQMQAMKTGALIRAACQMGAIAAGASRQDRMTLAAFGALAGQAFQLADDILDVTSATETLGKQSAKDGERGKATLVSLLGLAESRNQATMLLHQALEALAPFGKRGEWLQEAAKFIVTRNH